jgi:osmotically-inducible protein OsmY
MTNLQLEADVRWKLERDPRIPAPGEIDVKVTDGWVTVRGDVDYQFQSDAAFNDIASMRGVVGLTNEIKVVKRSR